MQITRIRRQGGAISLVAMVDVLLIMLVFFMVTSNYLDLDMIPVGETSSEAAAAARIGTTGPEDAPIMVRIGADGRSYLHGRALSPDALTDALKGRQPRGADIQVLPSGQADVQALVRTMDAITRAGERRVRLVRLEPRP